MLNRKSFLKSVLAIAFAAPQIAFSIADFKKLKSGEAWKSVEIQTRIIKIENQFWIAEFEETKKLRFENE